MGCGFYGILVMTKIFIPLDVGPEPDGFYRVGKENLIVIIEPLGGTGAGKCHEEEEEKYGAMVQWCHGAVVPWCNGDVVTC